MRVSASMAMRFIAGLIVCMPPASVHSASQETDLSGPRIGLTYAVQGRDARRLKSEYGFDGDHPGVFMSQTLKNAACSVR